MLLLVCYLYRRLYTYRERHPIKLRRLLRLMRLLLIICLVLAIGNLIYEILFHIMLLWKIKIEPDKFSMAALALSNLDGDKANMLQIYRRYFEKQEDLLRGALPEYQHLELLRQKADNYDLGSSRYRARFYYEPDVLKALTIIKLARVPMISERAFDADQINPILPLLSPAWNRFILYLILWLIGVTILCAIKKLVCTTRLLWIGALLGIVYFSIVFGALCAEAMVFGDVCYDPLTLKKYLLGEIEYVDEPGCQRWCQDVEVYVEKLLTDFKQIYEDATNPQNRDEYKYPKTFEEGGYSPNANKSKMDADTFFEKQKYTNFTKYCPKKDKSLLLSYDTDGALQSLCVGDTSLQFIFCQLLATLVIIALLTAILVLFIHTRDCILPAAAIEACRKRRLQKRRRRSCCAQYCGACWKWLLKHRRCSRKPSMCFDKYMPFPNCEKLEGKKTHKHKNNRPVVNPTTTHGTFKSRPKHPCPDPKSEKISPCDLIQVRKPVPRDMNSDECDPFCRQTSSIHHVASKPMQPQVQQSFEQRQSSVSERSYKKSTHHLVQQSNESRQPYASDHFAKISSHKQPCEQRPFSVTKKFGQPQDQPPSEPRQSRFPDRYSKKSAQSLDKQPSEQHQSSLTHRSSRKSAHILDQQLFEPRQSNVSDRYHKKFSQPLDQPPSEQRDSSVRGSCCKKSAHSLDKQPGEQHQSSLTYRPSKKSAQILDQQLFEPRQSNVSELYHKKSAQHLLQQPGEEHQASLSDHYVEKPDPPPVQQTRQRCPSNRNVSQHQTPLPNQDKKSVEKKGKVSRHASSTGRSDVVESSYITSHSPKVRHRSNTTKIRFSPKQPALSPHDVEIKSFTIEQNPFSSKYKYQPRLKSDQEEVQQQANFPELQPVSDHPHLEKPSSANAAIIETIIAHARNELFESNNLEVLEHPEESISIESKGQISNSQESQAIPKPSAESPQPDPDDPQTELKCHEYQRSSRYPLSKIPLRTTKEHQKQNRIQSNKFRSTMEHTQAPAKVAPESKERTKQNPVFGTSNSLNTLTTTSLRKHSKSSLIRSNYNFRRKLKQENQSFAPKRNIVKNPASRLESRSIKISEPVAATGDEINITRTCTKDDLTESTSGKSDKEKMNEEEKPPRKMT